MRLGYALRATQVAAALLVTAAPAIAQTPICETPANIVRLNNTLPRVAVKLAAGQPITIVAIGSSSTAGAGASTPGQQLSKPAPGLSLGAIPAAEIHRHQPRRERRRDQGDADASRQHGSLREARPRPVAARHQFGAARSSDRPGCRDPRRHQPDQARRRRRRADRSAIRAEGDRQDAMHENGGDDRRHREVRKCSGVPALRADAALACGPRHAFRDFISSDGLHLNDWSYNCWAKGLANAIAEAATRPVLSATAAPATR